MATLFDVKFGSNKMVSCTCRDTYTNPTQTINKNNYCHASIYYNILSTIGYVAAFGNSNPNYKKDWVALSGLPLDLTACTP